MSSLLKLMVIPFVFALMVSSQVTQISAEDAGMSDDAAMAQNDPAANPDVAGGDDSAAAPAPAPKKVKKHHSKMDKLKKGARSISHQAHLFKERAPHRMEMIRVQAAHLKERATHRAAMLKHKARAAFHKKQAAFHSAQAKHHGKQAAVAAPVDAPQDDAAPMDANVDNSNVDDGAVG